jgi:hypothetical protein
MTVKRRPVWIVRFLYFFQSDVRVQISDNPSGMNQFQLCNQRCKETIVSVLIKQEGGTEEDHQTVEIAGVSCANDRRPFRSSTLAYQRLVHWIYCSTFAGGQNAWKICFLFYTKLVLEERKVSAVWHPVNCKPCRLTWHFSQYFSSCSTAYTKRIQITDWGVSGEWRVFCSGTKGFTGMVCDWQMLRVIINRETDRVQTAAFFPESNLCIRR